MKWRNWLVLLYRGWELKGFVNYEQDGFYWIGYLLGDRIVENPNILLAVKLKELAFSRN